MTRFRIFASVLVIGGLIAVTHSVHAQAGASAAPQQAHEEHHLTGDQPPVTQAQEAQMMGMRQGMMANMKAMDAMLDALVTKMNAATGDANVEVITELLAVIVQQRTENAHV